MNEVTADKPCRECDTPAVKRRLVTGDDLEFWCEGHCQEAQERMLKYLGQDGFDLLFDARGLKGAEKYFWVRDLAFTMDLAASRFFEEIARGLTEVGASPDQAIQLEADLLKIKLEELTRALQMSREPDVNVAALTALWTSPDYLNAIGGEWGDKARRIFVANPLIPDNEPHLAALALIAARVDSYAQHPQEKKLVSLEQPAWERHSKSLIPYAPE